MRRCARCSWVLVARERAHIAPCPCELPIPLTVCARALWRLGVTDDDVFLRSRVVGFSPTAPALLLACSRGLPLDRRLTVDAFIRRLRAAKQRGWPIVIGFAKLSAAEEERGSDTFDALHSGHGGEDAKPASSSFMGCGGTDDAVDEYDRGGEYTSGRRAGSPLRSSDSSRSIGRRRHGDEDAASSSFMGCGGTDDAVDEYDGGGKYTSGRRAGSSVRSSDSSRSIGRRRRREPYTVDRSHEYDDTYALCGCNTVDGGI